MARKKVVEEETQEVEQTEDDGELTMDDFFSQEVDMGEYEEVAKALVVPDGKYYTQPPFSSKLDSYETKIQQLDDEGNETGDTIELRRGVVRFYDRVVNVDNGATYMLGINVSPVAVYTVGQGEDRKSYRIPVPGSRPDPATKNFHQAVKLYKKENGVPPRTRGELFEFLSRTPLRLTNKVMPARSEGEEPSAFVVGFSLANS